MVQGREETIWPPQANSQTFYRSCTSEYLSLTQLESIC